MGKYAEALGYLEFSVGGVDFVLRPRKGDNLRFIKIQREAGKDQAKLLEKFVPFVTDLVAREEDLAPEDREELETFVELNAYEFLKEIMVGFRWTTREALEEAERKQVQDFPKAVTN